MAVFFPALQLIRMRLPAFSSPIPDEDAGNCKYGAGSAPKLLRIVDPLQKSVPHRFVLAREGTSEQVFSPIQHSLRR
jgi:hypothetical protein